MRRLIRFHFMHRLVLFASLCLLLAHPKKGTAQVVNWPNPEVETLYKSAQASLSSGAYQKAIASYQQAIPLAPQLPILYRDLANAYYRAGMYEKAEKTITPLIEKDGADAISFSLASSIQTALKNDKQAKKYLEKGLEKYPSSGYLFYELGKYFEEKRDEQKALTQWVAGLQADPSYPLNYYAAAQSYLLSKTPIWAIIYGEIFANLERSTPRSQEARKLLLAAYKKFYSSPGIAAVPAFGKKEKETIASDFEEAARQTLIKLAPVLADGITTENLIMLRTRFTMDWMANYQKKFPYTLFDYWDTLLREGHFDAYNQWLFGKTENASQFEAWTKFHPEVIPAYNGYYQEHPLMMTGADNYNQGISKKIFESTPNRTKR